MNRTCGNCCAYDVQFGCVNGIHDPGQPHICCAHHQTPAEFEADVQAIERFRVRIGLPPRRGWRDDEPTGANP